MVFNTRETRETKMTEKMFNVIRVRSVLCPIWAESKEKAIEEALKRSLDPDAIDRLRGNEASSDFIAIEDGDIEQLRKTLTCQEMYNHLQAFVGLYGHKKLFELIRGDFHYHAFDRGENEDWKRRPKNEEQFDLIDKLSSYTEEEFRTGL